VLVLTVDYFIARSRKPADDERIASMQVEVEQDSSLAPALAEFQAEVTAHRHARRSRKNQIVIVLIAAAGAFIAFAKWLVAMKGRQALPMEKLVEIAPAVSASSGARSPARRAAGPPSDELDLTFVDELIEREGRDRESAIVILQAIQSHYRYLPDEALHRVCERTEITPAQIAGTSSFYSQFRRSPVGEHVVRVCHGTACHVAGARQITDELRRHLKIPDGADTDPDRLFTVDEVACLGCCSLAPVLMVDEHTAGKLTPSSACDALDVVAEKEPA
jgi:NADH:ubiquinone oxidoreductase subunit E